MKKILFWRTVVMLIIAMTFIAIGCNVDKAAGKEVDTAAEEEKEKFVIGYDIYYEGNAWSLQLAEEFKYGIETFYADMVEEVYYTSTQDDTTKQLNNFDDLMTKGCDMIFITPIEPGPLVDKISAALDKGVKVVVFHSGIDGDDYTAYVNVDEIEMGKYKAEWLSEQIGGKGEVVIMNGIKGCQSADEATEGARLVFDANPDITVVQEVYTDWDYAKTKIEMANVLQAYPNLAGVWSYDDPGAEAEAFLEGNHPWIPITWEDENRALRVWKENIDNGFIGRVITKPNTVSRLALDVGMKILKGEAYEKDTMMPIYEFGEDEIDNYYRPELPDQFFTISNLPDDRIEKLFDIEIE